MRSRLLLLALAVPSAAVAQLAPATCTPAAPPAVGEAIRLPVTLVNNHVYVKVCVAGRELDFILDTGAGYTAFDLRVANELGLPVVGEARGRGAGAGSVAGARLDTTRVWVGSASVLARTALDFHGVSMAEGFMMQGILGHDFISQWVLAIDYQAAEITLHDRKSFRYAGPGTVLPIDFDRNNHPHTRAQVVVGGKPIDMKATVDVGASSVLSLTKPFVQKHKLRERVQPTMRTVAGGGLGGAITTHVGRVDALRIGPYEIARPITALHGDSAGIFSENVWDANIGGGALRRFKVWFDYGRKQMILEPRAEELALPVEGDMTGLRMRGATRLDSIVVTWILPGSPAEEAGARAGDVVVAVEGNPVTTSTLREMRPLMRRIGEPMRLTVVRGGERIELRIIPRRMI